MSFHSLSWTNIILSSDIFHASEHSIRSSENLEWQDSAATLFITMENREQIALKMDNEIYELKVNILFFIIPPLIIS
jgi:hypothetical protein